MGVGDSIDIYKILEPYYNDFRKIKYQRPDGVFQILHIDEFVDNLLHEERFLSMQLPRLVKRRVFEANDQLEPRISPLEDEFQEMCEKEELLGKAGTSSEFSDTDDELEAKYAGFGKMKLPGLDKKKKTSKKKKISKVSENFQDTDEENEAFLDPRQKKRRLNEQQDADMFGDQANLGGLLKNKDGETAAGPSLPPNYTAHLSSEEEEQDEGEEQYYKDLKIIESRRRKAEAVKRQKDRELLNKIKRQNNTIRRENESYMIEKEREEEAIRAQRKEEAIARSEAFKLKKRQARERKFVEKELKYIQENQEKEIERIRRKYGDKAALELKMQMENSGVANVNEDRRNLDDMK